MYDCFFAPQIPGDKLLGWSLEQPKPDRISLLSAGSKFPWSPAAQQSACKQPRLVHLLTVVVIAGLQLKSCHVRLDGQVFTVMLKSLIDSLAPLLPCLRLHLHLHNLQPLRTGGGPSLSPRPAVSLCWPVAAANSCSSSSLPWLWR